MGRAVGADIAGAVDREAHRQALDGDVVHDLVVGALQEGGVDGAEGLQPSAARPAAKVTACCSAMPTSKVRSGRPCRTCRGRCRGHGGGDGDDAVVGSASFDQAWANTLV
jgi:hypothetical protein